MGRTNLSAVSHPEGFPLGTSWQCVETFVIAVTGPGVAAGIQCGETRDAAEH